MVDQLAADWLPAYGHDIVHAPSLTALAAEGVTFDAAYCPSPPVRHRARRCSPAASRLTPVFDNAAELPVSSPTVAHHLRAAGYHTALAGKMHFIGPDQMHGFEERLTPDVYPAGLDWTPDWRLPGDRAVALVSQHGQRPAPRRVRTEPEHRLRRRADFRTVRKLFDLVRYGRDGPFGERGLWYKMAFFEPSARVH